MIPQNIGVEVAKGLWHWTTRTVSVLCILIIVVGGPWFAYEKGKMKGYSLCAKDRPTYGNVGTVQNCDPKDVPITLLRISKMGFVWFRK